MKQRVSVRVKPGSKKGPLVELQPDGEVVIYVRERAIDGVANAAVIKLLAEYFDVPKSCITIIRGHTTRTKVIQFVK